MAFPPHIDRVLLQYGLRADTRAALYDLYEHLGNPALDVFADLAETLRRMDEVTPEDLASIRETVIQRFVERNHSRWLEGMPTPSFWHSRLLEGRAAGLVTPLGRIRLEDGDSAGIWDQLDAVCGQTIPSGLLLMSQNAHFGGRIGTFSFDLVPTDEGDAMAVALAEGRQHTIPGSVGETSGSWDAANGTMLLWEVQPNVLKPGGGRNSEISKTWRSFREWHLITLVAALKWLTDRGADVFFVAEEALAVTHQVNPNAVLSDAVAAHYGRTTSRAVAAFESHLEPATEAEVGRLIELELPNTALTRHLTEGHGGVLRMVRDDGSAGGTPLAIH